MPRDDRRRRAGFLALKIADAIGIFPAAFAYYLLFPFDGSGIRYFFSIAGIVLAVALPFSELSAVPAPWRRIADIIAIPMAIMCVPAAIFVALFGTAKFFGA